MTKNEVEIQKLKDDVDNLKEADKLNSQEHKQIMDLLKPISDTYKTVNTLSKWLMAILVLMSVLFGIISSWTRIIDIFKK